MSVCWGRVWIQHPHPSKNSNRRVREDTHLNNVCFILAASALKRILLQVCNGYQTTMFTNMDSVCITLIKQPLFEKVSSTMGNHAISFHFSKSKTTITGPSLSWLPCQDLNRATPTWMDLVIDHVFQSLVVSGAKEYQSTETSTCVTVVHSLKATHLIATFVKSFADIVHLQWNQEQETGKFWNFEQFIVL